MPEAQQRPPVVPNQTVSFVASPAVGDRLLSVLKRPSWLWGLLALEVLALHLYMLPTGFTFDGFAFADKGANFVVQFLVRQGYRPNIDFGYPYGALSILFGRIWFSLFGMTPVAYQAGVIFCDLLFAWAVTRFACALELGFAGLAFLFVTLPYALFADFTFGHTWERVLMALALGEHCRGRRANALGFATAAVFAKPAMGYVYGALLLVGIARTIIRLNEPKMRLFARELLPAAVTGVLLLGASSLAYGVMPSVSMLLPLRGIQIYRALHFGFFTGVGRDFWYHPGAHVAYYFGTVIALWFAATTCLVAGGIRAAIALSVATRSGAPAERNLEVVFCCAAMQVAFVTSFFGGPASSMYYPYVLFMGVAAMSVWGLLATRVTAALILFGVLGHKSMLAVRHVWRETARSPSTAGLWAPADERREWERVLELVVGHKAVVLVHFGAAALLFDRFEKPVAAYLIPGGSAAGDVSRELAQLSQAEMIVVTDQRILARLLDLKQVLAGWRVRWQGRFFTLYERSPLSGRLPNHAWLGMVTGRRVVALAG